MPIMILPQDNFMTAELNEWKFPGVIIIIIICKGTKFLEIEIK